MKAVLFVALCCAAYYTQAQAYFSENNVQLWLAEHNTKALSGNVQACDDFAERVQVAFEAEHGIMWQVSGGKTEMCRHLLQSTRVLSSQNPQTQIEQVQVELMGFPWLGAKVSYIEHLHTQGKNAPSTETISRNEVVINRTVTGLKIYSFLAKSAS